MKAIVLAAGRGSRLGKYTEDKPKSMIELNGKTLMQRNLENLRDAGFSQVVLVVGYHHEILENFLQQHFPSSFYKVVMNPDYTRGSGSSLICAAGEMTGDMVIVESDLLYHGEIVKRMASSKLEHAMGLGYFHHNRREVKLYLKNGYIAKAQWGEPNDPEATGEWVGFTRLSGPSTQMLRSLCEAAQLQSGIEYSYEDFIFKLVENFKFVPVYIQDLPWIEIDNEIDLNRAETEIGPKIDGKLSHSA